MRDDQKAMWNRQHAAGRHDKWSEEPRRFAVKIIKDLKPGSKLLELGCGVGSDARFFAQNGLDVLATDFSDIVIKQNKQRGETANLKFDVLDISEPFPYEDKCFDAVYAYLSMHYYSDAKTHAIFGEIARILKTGGKFYFACKSVHDSKYGEGEEVEKDVFIRDGHLRHFFSESYSRELLAKDFAVVKLEEKTDEYIDGISSFIECWALIR